MFSGIYHGKVRHQPDLNAVLERARGAGVERLVVTAGSLSEAQTALQLISKHDWLFTTVGVHPTRCGEFASAASVDDYLAALSSLIEQNPSRVVAVGECGLDYDRLNFCDKSTQLRFFELQLSLAERFCLPLFLHCRVACSDVLEILQRYRLRRKGVVHSFDGTLQEAQNILQLGFDIGINGCSLKTAENLSVVSQLPVERLHLETDAPWCDIRPSHASHQHLQAQHVHESCRKEKWRPGCMVKSRNEPANIRQVLDVLVALRKQDAESLAETIYQNSYKMFFSTV